MTNPFRLELFRPMSLDDFHCLEFDDALYMQDNWNPCYEKRVCVYTLLSNMTGICIRKGACILPPSVDECAHSVRLWKTPKTKFTLHIENEVPDYDIECSKAVVLDMLTEGTDQRRRSPLFGQSARKGCMTLTFHPLVFEAFIRVVSGHALLCSSDAHNYCYHS